MHYVIPGVFIINLRVYRQKCLKKSNILDFDFFGLLNLNSFMYTHSSSALKSINRSAFINRETHIV